MTTKTRSSERTTVTPDKGVFREDQEAIQTVQTWVQQGLMTPEEATNFILGRIF